MLSAKYRKVLDPWAKKVAKYFCWINPNTITVFSIIFAIISAYYFMHQEWLLGSVTGLVAGALDVIDGSVARMRRKESKWGAYLDAVADRYVEGAILFGIGYGTGYWVFIVPILFASLVIPYAKARAAMETKVDNVNWPDLFERAERLALILIGIPLAYYAGYFYEGALFYYLFALAVVFNIGALQRIARARRLLK